MKNRIFKILLASFSIFPSATFSFNSAAEIINTTGCQGCHTGTLGIPKEMAFALEDPDNNFTATTQYEAGKTYRIHLRFQPNGNANMVGFKLGAQYNDLQKAGEISDPPIGDFARSSDDSTVAAYVDADLPAQITDFYMEWEAPDSEKNVVFLLDRVEANGNNGTGGDRGNPFTERFVIQGPGGEEPSLDDEEGEASEDPTSENPGLDVTSTTRDQTAYGSGFSGGCASIHGELPLKDSEISFWVLLGVFFTFTWIRQRFVKSLALEKNR